VDLTFPPPRHKTRLSLGNDFVLVLAFEDETVHQTEVRMANAREKRALDVPQPNWFRFATDPLSQVTDQVRLSSMFCGVVRATPPFTFRATRDGLLFHHVTHGQLYLGPIEGTDVGPTLVETGDVFITSHGLPYRIQYPLDVPSALETTPRLVEDSSKPQGQEIEWLGMACHLDSAHRNLLTDFLPHAIHLKKATPGLTRWLKRTIDLFRAEHQASSPGRGSVLSRLAEIVCVQALRIWIEQMPPESKGWLQGLKDERIAVALQAIHKDPGCRWTVASLARRAGMSRTVFATRFKALIGESPMEYVSRWRVHRAIGLLERDGVSLKSVVEASGYKSAATFRMNFKRQFGKLPSDYRRRNRQLEVS
jgi:AraC-like DNA-binding protein